MQQYISQHNQNETCWCEVTYIVFGRENIGNDPKFNKDGDHVKLSRYENLFAEGCTPN